LTAVGRVEEPPYLEFVHALRARGMPDLAVQYLEHLRTHAPAGLAEAIPLEIADARLDMARLAPDSGRRDGLYRQTLAEYEGFLQSHPASPQTAHVALQAARVAVQEAGAALDRARAQESVSLRLAWQRRARAQFSAARDRLRDAIVRIDSQLASSKLTEEQRRALADDRARADLEGGLLVLGEMRTYDDTPEVLHRGELARRAIAVLERVAAGNEQNPLYWEAQAWIANGCLEIDSPREAGAKLDRVCRAEGPATETGKRLAGYFRILLFDKDPQQKEPWGEKLKAAEEWLRRYPEAVDTPEARGVRFQLAESCLALAGKRRGQRADSEATQLEERAEQLYEALEHGDHEVSARARERRLRIRLARTDERHEPPIDQLADLEACLLRARLISARLADEQQKLAAEVVDAAGDKREEQRRRRMQQLVTVLERGLALADGSAKPEDRAEARYLLAYAYLTTNDPYRAAVLGEALAREEPRAGRAPAAAGYALEGYAAIIASAEGRDPRADVDADRRRLVALARYMEATWPDDSATDLARHQLAALALRDHKYPDAIELLSRIGDTYGAYTLSQYQLATTAFQAQKEGLAPAPGRPPWHEQALAALRAIPDLAADADVVTTGVFFRARLELARLLFAARQFDEMEHLSEWLTHHFASARLDDASRRQLSPAIAALPLYATYARAAIDFRAGRVGECRTLLDPVVDEVAQDKLLQGADIALVRALLGLAMRANLQDGRTARANDILALFLKRSAGDPDATNAFLQEQAQQLRAQLDELRRKGSEAQPELAMTVDNIGTFLDQLAGPPADRLTPEVARFVALGYSALDRHKQAAEVLGRISAPTTPAQQAVYHSARLLRARELRRVGQFDAATSELREILASDWGRRSIEARRERVLVLEDRGEYTAAAREWNRLLAALRPRIDEDARLREQYFDFYFRLVDCLVRAGIKEPDGPLRQDAFRRVAGLIVKLEAARPDMGGTALKERYEELLRREPPLRALCADLKKEKR
jgi:hypothetical protein